MSLCDETKMSGHRDVFDIYSKKKNAAPQVEYRLLK